MKGCPECGQRFLGNEEFCPKDGATLVDIEAAASEDPLIGTTLDSRYSIEKKIGEGGMGVVYLATHAVIGKKHAIKVLRGELSSESEVAERFTQEARAAAAIGNEHIIEITDFGQLPDGSAYFVMEFLDGKDLQTVMEEDPKMDNARVMHIMAQCCDALSAAHNIEIVHRDLKPENIILIERAGDPDFVKILDFGIAKVARETGRLTRTGVIFGTPQYMSPEQAAGTNIDARTDVYSLGIIMYEMLSGHVPFEADTFMGVLTKHLYEEPIPPRRLVPPVEVSQSTESVVLKAMAKKPEKRYQSMVDFREDVLALKEGRTPAIVSDQMRTTSMSTVPPPSPTAIVGQAAEMSDIRDHLGPKKKRWPIFAGIGAAVAAIAVVGVVLGTGGGDGKKAEAQPANKAVVPVVAAQPPPEDKQEEKAPEESLVKISSKPVGASLYQNGVLIGQVPVDVPKPASGKPGVQYQLRLGGFDNLDIMITGRTPEEFNVALSKTPELKKEVKASASHSRRRKKSTKKPSEKKSAIKVTPVEEKKKKKKTVKTDLVDPWAQ